MTVSIRDPRSTPSDRQWIQSVYREYLSDLAEQSANTGVYPVLSQQGDDSGDWNTRWFADSHSYPLLILQDNRPVGFALVSRPLATRGAAFDFRMAEFYVVPSARRRNVGSHAAALIFKRFTGKWEVSEFVSNKPAVAFWRRVIADFTHGQYREIVASGEVLQRFESPQK